MSSQYSINANTPKAPVGLSQNPDGIPFQCGTCRYFRANDPTGSGGQCSNPDPRLNGVGVHPEWCCNNYDHDGMQTLIK